MSNRVPGLFFVGTDTGVGKTYVAALIARQLTAEGRKVGIYKPAASGCRQLDGSLLSDDAVALWEAAGQPGDLHHVCPQLFEAPLAPHLAARAEGRMLDADLLRRGLEYWQQRSEIILVEGAGGLMSPLGDDEYVADLAREFGFPLVVVSPNVLGTINQTLQTLITASVFRGLGNWGLVHFSARKRILPTNGGPKTWTCPLPAVRATKIGTVPCEHLLIAGVVLNHPAPPSANDASVSSNRRELAARCAPPILGEVAWGAEQIDAAIDWFALAR